MEEYKNLGGNSGIKAYAIGKDYIEVQFSDNSIYRYSYGRAGAIHVEEMKKLAVSGRGLNSYIMKYVRLNYDPR